MALDFFDVTRATVKNVLNANGVLEEVSANVPAFEFNPDGSYKGCLIEPASTNRITQSDNLADFSPRLNTTINTSANLSAPNSTNTASSVFLENVETLIGLDQGLRFTDGLFGAGTTMTFSVFVRANNSGNLFRLGMWNTSLGIFRSEIFEATQNWQRYSFTYTTGAGQNHQFAYLLGWSDDCNVEVWGAQWEEGFVATSYTKTTDSAVTRNADVITKTDAADLIGQTEGRVIQDVEFASETTLHVMGVDVVVTKGRIEVRYSPTQIQVFLDGVSQGILNGVFDFSGTDEIQLGHYDGASQMQGHISLYAQHKTAQ